MVDLNITLPVELPAWCPQDADGLMASLQASAASQAQRERFKYLRPKQLGQLGQLEYDQSTQLPAISAGAFTLPADWAQILASAPDVACDLLRQPGQKLNVEEDGDLDISDVTGPLQILVAAGVSLNLIDGCDKQARRTLLIHLHQGANVTHHRSCLDPDTDQFTWLRTIVGTGADYTLNHYSLGSSLKRHDIQIQMAGSGAKAQLNSAAFVPANKHLDQHVLVEHIAPDAHSEQTVHNIVDHKGTSVFNGRIHIHEHCPNTAAHLSNRNLGIADIATIHTRPELEIYTDEVECSHGATVGQIDENELFYFASRGIDSSLATRLIAQGFLNTCIQGVFAEQAETTFSNAFGQS